MRRGAPSGDGETPLAPSVASASGASPPSKTLPVTDAEAVASSLRARLAQRKPFLVVMTGADVGVRWRIDGSAVVGREAADCDFVLRDGRASKKHARFEVRGHEVWVVDLGSTNGTLVNEHRVTEARVGTGDKVLVGTTLVKLEWQDALEQEFHQELERLLNIDELTGLANKRKFDGEARLAIEGCMQRGEPASVLMMDLDGIKRINDTHGHEFGAYCIAESGALIGRIVTGRGGLATRWGGDEYSAVLPATSAEAACAAAEEILAAIRAHGFVRDDVALAPGISIGVAAGPADGGDLESLQRRADEALYRAKRAGKGRVSR